MININTTSDILYNMYKGGVLKLEEQAHITTTDNQFKVTLKREQKGFFSEDTNYICNISVFDNFTNNIIVSIDCTIKDIIILLDNFQMFINWCDRDIIVPPISPYNTTGCFYFFRLCSNLIPIDMNSVMPDISESFLIINEYNPLNEQVVERVRLRFETDFDIQQFMDNLYFVFLIDIEDEVIREQVMEINNSLLEEVE